MPVQYHSFSGTRTYLVLLAWIYCIPPSFRVFHAHSTLCLFHIILIVGNQSFSPSVANLVRFPLHQCNSSNLFATVIAFYWFPRRIAIFGHCPFSHVLWVLNFHLHVFYCCTNSNQIVNYSITFRFSPWEDFLLPFFSTVICGPQLSPLHTLGCYQAHPWPYHHINILHIHFTRALLLHGIVVHQCRPKKSSTSRLCVTLLYSFGIPLDAPRRTAESHDPSLQPLAVLTSFVVPLLKIKGIVLDKLEVQTTWSTYGILNQML